MSRVEACLPKLPQPFPQKGQDDMILIGRFPAWNLKRMSTKRLECLLEKLIERTFGEESENMRCPQWWPKSLTFSSVPDMRKKFNAECNWRSIVMQVVESCMAYYKKSPVIDLVDDSKPPVKEDIYSKPNMNGIIRKRNSTSPLKFNNKKPRMEEPFNDILNNIINDNFTDGNTTSPIEERPVVPVQIISNNMLPIIKLNDILKKKPVKKCDFMDFLNLVPVSNEKAVAIPPDDIPSRKYSSTMPFSSDIGRIFMRRERYNLSLQLYHRKEERLEYYLKEQPVIIDKTYEITYNKKTKCEHVYKFPQRQQRQGANYLKMLQKALCKPVSVRLEKTDISDYVNRNSLHKQCKVMVEKLIIENYVKLK